MSDTLLLDDLFKLFHWLKKQFYNELEALELAITPMHVRVIKTVSRKSLCTPMDIANLLERDKAQVTRLINGLIEEGYLIKEPHPHDKRSQCLLLGAKGEEVLIKINEIDKKVLALITQNIEASALVDFQATSKAIAQNLKANTAIGD